MPRQTINLTFHGIGPPERALDDAEADVWVSRDAFVSVLDAVSGRDDVRITFDDGNASDVEHALPALQQRGLTATFFVVAGRLGVRGFLGADGVRALTAAGMTIGSHGMRHRPWRELDEPALRVEILDARRQLEEIVGRPVRRAACPFGAYDRRVLRALRRGAYEQVYTSDRGVARSDDWIQPRNTVHTDDDAALLDRILPSGSRTGLRRPLKLAAKRWR